MLGCHIPVLFWNPVPSCVSQFALSLCVSHHVWLVFLAPDVHLFPITLCICNLRLHLSYASLSLCCLQNVGCYSVIFFLFQVFFVHDFLFLFLFFWAYFVWIYFSVLYSVLNFCTWVFFVWTLWINNNNLELCLSQWMDGWMNSAL